MTYHRFEQPLALLGGSFDPVHLGHLWLAQAVCARLMVQVRFMPTPCSPFKTTHTSARHRLHMLRLALRDTPFGIETLDLKQPAPSYSIDVLQKIRQREGPTRSIILIIGQDSLETMHRWKGQFELLTFVHLWVFPRWSETLSDLSAQPLIDFINQNCPTDVSARLIPSPLALSQTAAGHLYADNRLPPDISSSAIRSQLVTHRALVPKRIWAYNRKTFLYG